jgi:hypothetical protein
MSSALRFTGVEGCSQGIEGHAPDAGKLLTIRIRSATGNFEIFKVKDTTLFEKIVNAYASKVGIEPGPIRLVWECRRVTSQDCPRDFDMQDDDIIEASITQVGY